MSSRGRSRSRRDPALTLEVYAQTTTERDRAAAAMIDEYFASVIAPARSHL